MILELGAFRVAFVDFIMHIVDIFVWHLWGGRKLTLCDVLRVGKWRWARWKVPRWNFADIASHSFRLFQVILFVSNPFGKVLEVLFNFFDLIELVPCYDRVFTNAFLLPLALILQGTHLLINEAFMLLLQHLGTNLRIEWLFNGLFIPVYLPIFHWKLLKFSFSGDQLILDLKDILILKYFVQLILHIFNVLPHLLLLHLCLLLSVFSSPLVQFVVLYAFFELNLPQLEVLLQLDLHLVNRVQYLGLQLHVFFEHSLDACGVGHPLVHDVPSSLNLTR